MKRLIIDSNNLGYAAHYSVGGLSSDGNRTGVIYGFLKKILFLAETFDTNQFIFCWDSKHNFRKKFYPKYKGNRWKNLTDEQKKERVIVRQQFKELRRKVLPELGFKNNYVQWGFESDDLMASIVYDNTYLKDNDFIMVTSDNDMYQCLNFCSIYNLQKNESFTKDDFIKKYKIMPEQWALAKAIGGCDSDNVKAVNDVADPKKETSRALSYIRGELKKGIIYNKIKEFEEDIYRYNLN